MPIRVIPDRQRDPEREAGELSQFAEQDEELRGLAEILSAGSRVHAMVGTFNLESQVAAWKLYYDQAAKKWRRQYGYTPLMRARVLCASARAIAERQRVT